MSTTLIIYKEIFPYFAKFQRSYPAINIKEVIHINYGSMKTWKGLTRQFEQIISKQKIKTLTLISFIWFEDYSLGKANQVVWMN